MPGWHNARMQQAQAPKPLPEPRSAYRVFRSIATRWMDNDAYGHVNNVGDYSWFDTAVNAYLIEQGALRGGHFWRRRPDRGQGPFCARLCG